MIFFYVYKYLLYKQNKIQIKIVEFRVWNTWQFFISVDESVVLDKFILYHMECMNKWIDLYDIKREEVLKARGQFKRLNPRNTPLPTDLNGE